MNRLLLSSCLFALFTVSGFDVSWSQLTIAPGTPAVSEPRPLADAVLKLPIRVYLDYLVLIEGSVGSVEKLNLLVDTGAFPSVIDQKVARRLKLTELPERVNLWSKTFQTRRVILPSLRLGPIRAESLPALMEDLSFLQKAIGHKVDGIVGLDLLRKSSFTINYATKEMLFGPVDSLTFSAPFDTDTPVVTIRTTFQGQVQRLVVDTGGPDLMLFQSRMSNSAHFQELGTENVADVGGTFARRRVRIPDVYLGNEPIGSQIAFLINDRKDEGDDFDGVLGFRSAHFRKIAFDFDHRMFRWELYYATVHSNNDHLLIENQVELDKTGSEVSYLRDQAGRGDAMAAYRLGRLYMTGTGVPSDYKEAAKYLHAADEQGLTKAKVVLGYLYENGKGVPRDYRRAFEYYAAAARQGDLTAANNLAAMYGHGRGVRRDVQQSVNWYRHAAEGGNVVAQCNLASLYFWGRGVAQDYAQAAQWFRKAAESGYPPGQESLAWMFNTGTGVARDYAMAAHWLELAAHSSYSRAQLELGYLYEQGKGVPLDYVTAYIWYKTAESGGDGRAREELKRVSTLMTKQQISEANAARADYRALHPKEEVVEEPQSIGSAFNPQH